MILLTHNKEINKQRHPTVIILLGDDLLCRLSRRYYRNVSVNSTLPAK